MNKNTGTRFCSLEDYISFRDHVMNDKSWTERNRVFTYNELLNFPFKEKIPSLLLPLKRGKNAFDPAIKEYKQDLSKSKEYPLTIVLSVDFWESMPKKWC